MPLARYTSKVASKDQLTETFVSLKLELTEPHTITFQAGQYVLLDCPGIPQKRAYSIASAPRLDHAIELLIELIPGGQTSGHIEKLVVGDELCFYAPVGGFMISDAVQQDTCPLTFVGTGSGLAPLRAMILDQLRSRETKRPIHLLWGMRFATDLFWLDYWQELADNYPNFTYTITLSKPPEEWTLARGRVTDVLATDAIDPTTHFYLCGSTKMLTDVMAVLAGRGVDAAHIHHEKFS